MQMNIGYLTLNRIMGTLSGGELTRLYLAEFMATSENTVIIVDEISVGLDHNTLLKILEQTIYAFAVFVISAIVAAFAS